MIALEKLRLRRRLRRAARLGLGPGAVPRADWERAIELGVVPPQVCPMCGGRMTLDAEVDAAAHAGCVEEFRAQTWSPRGLGGGGAP